VRAQFFHTISNAADAVGQAALNLLMPPQCPVTGEAAAAPGKLSPAGWTALHFIERPFCGRCGIPFSAEYGESVECPACIAEPPVFDRARAALSYNEAARKVVSGLKFSDRMEYAGMLGGWMARAGAGFVTRETLIMPVPLHWRRLMARRYNQSALLARSVGETSCARVLLRGLRRTRPTPPQKEIPSVEARRRNVAGAFAVDEKYRAAVKGEHIVLIDDVLTSGATASACARALKQAGASQVDVLVLARVVKGGAGAI
jgi:ComF family protein